jgi:uncharacterized membrane protein YfcA
MANHVLVLALGLAAGSLSGIIGTGASIMLLPLLAWISTEANRPNAER